MKRPLCQLQFCPVCGAKAFVEHDERAKKCMACGFVYYFNPPPAVVCSIKNAEGELLLVCRGREPAGGTLDLFGGLVDMFKSGEKVARRETREEVRLYIQNCRRLFSLPDLYMCSSSEVHTLGMSYKCLVDNFNNVHTKDDVAEIVILRPEDVNPEDSGLDSIRKAVPAYLRK